MYDVNGFVRDKRNVVWRVLKGLEIPFVRNRVLFVSGVFLLPS